MKVLFVISTLDTGGAQRVLSNLVMKLPEDWEIEILLNDDASISYPYKGKILSLNIEPEKNKQKLTYQLKVFLKRMHTLRRLKRSGKYDACISFMDSANFANILSGKKYCKVISSIHIHMTQQVRMSKKYQLFIKPFMKLYNFSDKVVAVSEASRRDLIENFGIKEERLVTIYNGIDLKQEVLQNNQEILPEYDFATMGRLDLQKGQWHLIKVFREFVKEVPSAKLVILGDGEYYDFYLEQIEKLNLQNNIILKGFVDNPLEEIQKSKIFVFPSLFEGFPNAIVEAMACGKPVISCDFDSGAREIIAPDTDCMKRIPNDVEYARYGILVPVCESNVPEDLTGKLSSREQELLEAMKRLYLDTAICEKYGQMSVERAGQLSVENMAEQWACLV